MSYQISLTHKDGQIGTDVNLRIDGGFLVGLSVKGAVDLLYSLSMIPALSDTPPKPVSTINTADIMLEAVETFRKRNAQYKDGQNNVGGVMMALFPDGVTLKTKEDFIKWHLLELLVVKITRFANGGLSHIDSIHDAGVYSFMIEKEVRQNG